MGKQGETATNKDNNINIIKGLIYSGIPSNMAGYCKLMAQNWHKSFSSCVRVVVFSCGQFHKLKTSTNYLQFEKKKFSDQNRFQYYNH